jgi:hypothetical protein
MGFSQTTITSVTPPGYSGFQVYLSWTSSSPSDTWFQVYIQEQLAWWGQTTSCRIAMPTAGPIRVNIGTVLPGEEQTDFSADLPSTPARRAELSWLGGTFEDADIAGFQVFGSDDGIGFGGGGYGDPPNGGYGGIDFSIVLADITAYPSGIITDGFGFGGFGYGGFGSAASTYTWTSQPLTSGNWFYAVVPYDQAGNLGTPATASVTITVPPLPPGLNDDNRRLTYTYNASDQEVTLNWLPSPG